MRCGLFSLPVLRGPQSAQQVCVQPLGLRMIPTKHLSAAGLVRRAQAE